MYPSGSYCNATGRVLVLGAQGAAGSAIAAAFERHGWEAVRAGRRRGAQRVVDLDRPETLAAAAGEVDAVVNAVPHPGLAAERAILRCGGLLLNVADRSVVERRRLRALPDPAGTVVLNWGIIPGLSALVAADLLARHEGANRVEVAVVFSATGTSGPAGGEFLRRELASVRRHATASVEFPEPIGRRRCLAFAENEDAWLGGLAQGRDVHAFVRLAEPALSGVLLGLNAAGLLPLLPAAAFRAMPTWRAGRARAPSRERFMVRVGIGSEGDEQATSTISGAGMYRATAEAAVAAAGRLIADGGTPGAGCFDPHEAFELHELRAPLTAAGVSVD